MIKKYLLIVLLFLSFKAKALDPSLFFFEEREQNEINSPKLIDGEYYSDILAFELSIENNLKAQDSKSFFQIGVGSISSKRFASEQRLGLNHKLNKKLSLSLRYQDVENFETARQQIYAGLNYQLNKKIYIGTFTALFSEKSKNDIGAMVGWKINSTNSIEAFLNLPDFSFNERNISNLENLKTSKHIGISYKNKISDRFRQESYFFINTPIKRVDRDLNEVYEFSETRMGTLILYKPSFSTHSLKLSAFKGLEGRYKASESESIWRRQGVIINYGVNFQKFKLGANFNYRNWSQGQSKVIHRNLIPYLWYKHKTQRALDSIELGLDTSFHNASGRPEDRNSLDRNKDVNARFNLRLNFKFSEKSFLNFLLSMDLEDASWEGGGGQFQVLF